MRALTASGISVRYGRVPALRDVSITVDEGSIVSVIGPNGAGKTTLLMALMGVLPSSGSVELFGQSLRGVTVEQRVRRGLSLVPEKRELFGTMPVRDNLVLGGFPRWPTGPGAEMLDAVYARFPRLKERAAKDANTLSGGERQMLALGRALMSSPRVLMLDEPSLGLAPLIVRQIFEIVMELRKTGVSILLVEQNARAALEVADYGYVIENGAVTLEGPAKDLAGNPRVAETYLGKRAAN